MGTAHAHGWRSLVRKAACKSLHKYLGKCRTFCKQVACVLATEDDRELGKMLRTQHPGPYIAESTDCHVSITFSSFSLSHLLLFAFIFYTFGAFPTSFDANTILRSSGMSLHTMNSTLVNVPDLQYQHGMQKCNVLYVILHVLGLCTHLLGNSFYTCLVIHLHLLGNSFYTG